MTTLKKLIHDDCLEIEICNDNGKTFFEASIITIDDEVMFNCYGIGNTGEEAVRNLRHRIYLKVTRNEDKAKKLISTSHEMRNYLKALEKVK